MGSTHRTRSWRIVRSAIPARCRRLGAGERPRSLLYPPDDARGSEVAQLRFAVIVDEPVRGLEARCQLCLPGRGLQSPAHSHCDTQRIRPRDRANPAYPLRQGTVRVRESNVWAVNFGPPTCRRLRVRLAQRRHRVTSRRKTFRLSRRDSDAIPCRRRAQEDVW